MKECDWTNTLTSSNSRMTFQWWARQRMIISCFSSVFEFWLSFSADIWKVRMITWMKNDVTCSVEWSLKILGKPFHDQCLVHSGGSAECGYQHTLEESKCQISYCRSVIKPCPFPTTKSSITSPNTQDMWVLARAVMIFLFSVEIVRLSKEDRFYTIFLILFITNFTLHISTTSIP